MTPRAEMPFWDHVAELRRRLLIPAAALLIASAAAFCRSEKIMAVLVAPLHAEVGALYFFSPQEALLVRLKASLLVGAVALGSYLS